MSLKNFTETFGEDYDTPEEVLHDWENELNEYRLFIQRKPHEDSSV